MYKKFLKKYCLHNLLNKDLLNINRSNSVAKRNNNTSMYSTQSVPYSRVNNNPFTNAVRPAMNENINNINQVRSAISVNQNQNLLNNNKIQPKTTSDYSTMTMQYKKPYYTNNGNLAFQTPNPLMQNNFNNKLIKDKININIEMHIATKAKYNEF